MMEPGWGDGRETDAVRARYARRGTPTDARYSLLEPSVWQTVHERQRATLKLLRERGRTDLSALQVLEVGCGTGGNLQELLRFGFEPSRLRGVELLEDRYLAARHALPVATRLDLGDACALDVVPASQDIVLQSTVFTSLLDMKFQQCLADAMWRWVRPGGAVLWYDFVFNNPRNADVRGVPLRRLRELFPQARIHAQRVTLAPPLARRVVRVHPSFYTLFNAIPLLRSHLLAWIEKPDNTPS